jgi:hypothetical protein
MIKPVNNLQIHVYIDVTFALYDESMPHTGVDIAVNKMVMCVSSCKQKSVMKSPSEADLIGLTDNICLVEWFHEFIGFVARKQTLIPIIYRIPRLWYF